MPRTTPNPPPADPQLLGLTLKVSPQGKGVLSTLHLFSSDGNIEQYERRSPNIFDAIATMAGIFATLEGWQRKPRDKSKDN